MDGQSFAAELIDQSESNSDLGEGRQFLIEYWGEGNENTYTSDCAWSQHDRLAVRNYCNTTFAILTHFLSFRIQYDHFYCAGLFPGSKLPLSGLLEQYVYLFETIIDGLRSYLL